MTRRDLIILAILILLADLGVFYAALTLSCKSPSPGYLRVFAFYGTKQPDGSDIGSYVQVFVTVTGPESHAGTTTTDPWNPLNFTLAPGQYFISGTYDSTAPQNGTVNVAAGSHRDVYLNFGSTSLPP